MLFQAASENGYDIHAAKNGWALPMTKELAKESELPLHNGNHLDEYYRATRLALDHLQADYRAGLIKPAQLPEKLHLIAAGLKDRLARRELFLQATDPRSPGVNSTLSSQPRNGCEEKNNV